MHTIEIKGTNIKLQFPESPSDFNREQLLVFSRLMILYNQGEITFEQFKVRITYAFLNMKRSIDPNLEKNYPAVENVMRIAKLVENYFSEQDDSKSKVVKMEFHRQLLPRIKANGRTFHGPSLALFNTVYGEYLQALSSFVDFSETGDEAHLDRMIATLYRPAKWFQGIRKRLDSYKSDPRRAFNPEMTDHYVKHIKKLPPEVKHAIFLYFASCQHFLANSDELYIGGGNSMDISQLFKKSDSQGGGKGLGMIGTLYVISETQVFGDTEKTAKQNTYDVFAFLVHQAERKKEEIKQLKAQRNATVRRTGRVRR